MGTVERCEGGKSVGVQLVVHRRWNVYRSRVELSVLVHGRSRDQLSSGMA